MSGAASSEGSVHGHRFAEDDHRRNGPEHSHGLVDTSIKRSRDGLLVVGASLAVLTATAVAQAAIYVATGSVALLADLIHNAGDALTAVPLGVAFLLRSDRAERNAGLGVVLAILGSAVVAGVIAIDRIIHPLAPDHLLALGIAGSGPRRTDGPTGTIEGLGTRFDAGTYSHRKSPQIANFCARRGPMLRPLVHGISGQLATRRGGSSRRACGRARRCSRRRSTR